jgi:hypothetical protein
MLYRALVLVGPPVVRLAKTLREKRERESPGRGADSMVSHICVASEHTFVDFARCLAAISGIAWLALDTIPDGAAMPRGRLAKEKRGARRMPRDQIAPAGCGGEGTQGCVHTSCNVGL